jgi:hypothetical protein
VVARLSNEEEKFRKPKQKPRKNMHKILISAAIGAAMMMTGSTAKAQVDLSTYANPKDFLTFRL